MAHLFKPWQVRYVDATGRRVKKGTPGAICKRQRAKKWYGQFIDHTHTRRRVPLCRDKEAAQAKLARLLRKDEREAAGIADPFDEARKLPLSDHLAAYRRHLEAKGNAPDYIGETVHYVELIAAGCGFARLKDLHAGRVADWLHVNLTEAGRSPRTFNAYLTAIKGFCRWLVQDRRAPDSPLAHLTKVNEETDIRIERRNLSADEFRRLIDAARGSKKRFRRLSGEDRAMLYTVATYTGLRASELASLHAGSLDLEGAPPTIVVQAGYCKRRRRDVQPMPAWLADRLAAWLATKAPEALATLAIRPDDPQAIQAPENATRAKLWPGSWRGRAAEMLRADLACARAAWLEEAEHDRAEQAGRERSDYLVYEDQAGRVFDFHALRHQFISNLASAGVHPKVAQQLARHSTIDLTMNRYTHLAVADVAGALDLLPELPAGGPETEAARATGTEGKAAGGAGQRAGLAGGSIGRAKESCNAASASSDAADQGAVLVVPRVAPLSGKQGVIESTCDHESRKTQSDQERQKPL